MPATKGHRSPAIPKARNRMLWIMLGLAFCILAFMGAIYPLAMVGAPSTQTILIPKDATAGNVRDSLEKHFGHSYAKKVMYAVGLRHTDFTKRHGAYEIPEGASAFTAMRKLTSGAQTPVRITINGFRSLPLLVQRISRKLAFPADSLTALLNDTAFMSHYGLTPANAMALFVDDTYEVYWTSTPREVLEKIGTNFNYLWSEGRRKSAAALGLTPAGMMTIASIADEETNIKDEKGIIGRLYINRLNNGMRLQADPTVRFALGDFTLQRISRNDLQYDSPYNTYRVKGLPPGPIRTTSASTVIRILEAPDHPYLYMCAKEDLSGSHNFSTTYDQHLGNARRYQTELDRRGITR